MNLFRSCSLCCFLSLLSLPAIGWGSQEAKTATPPAETAIPVVFTRPIKVRTAKRGDRVMARTMQVVLYGPAGNIPKGSRVKGHVIDASYKGNTQQSSITFQFDKLIAKKRIASVCMSVRAMADSIDAYKATREATSLDTNASLGTTLVGGDHIRPGGKYVYATEYDKVGISNRFGIFSRLEPADSHSHTVATDCSGVATLQSVAIFSSGACGLYGFADTYLAATGAENPMRAITLIGKHHPIEIPSGSAALLQIVPCK